MALGSMAAGFRRDSRLGCPRRLAEPRQVGQLVPNMERAEAAGGHRPIRGRAPDGPGPYDRITRPACGKELQSVDRKSVVEGKRASARVAMVGRLHITKK